MVDFIFGNWNRMSLIWCVSGVLNNCIFFKRNLMESDVNLLILELRQNPNFSNPKKLKKVLKKKKGTYCGAIEGYSESFTAWRLIHDHVFLLFRDKDSYVPISLCILFLMPLQFLILFF